MLHFTQSPSRMSKGGKAIMKVDYMLPSYFEHAFNAQVEHPTFPTNDLEAGECVCVCGGGFVFMARKSKTEITGAWGNVGGFILSLTLSLPANGILLQE